MEAVNPAWNAASFDAAGWDKPQILGGPGGALKGLSCAGPPIREFSALKPVATKSIKPGVTVYDLGQNASVIARVNVTGPAGSIVRIIPAELTHPDGTVDRATVGGGGAWWQYTLQGGGVEKYEGKFFYQGASYLQVECLPASGGEALPEVKSIEGAVIHSDCPAVGEFSCSNDLLTKPTRSSAGPSKTTWSA